MLIRIHFLFVVTYKLSSMDMWLSRTHHSILHKFGRLFLVNMLARFETTCYDIIIKSVWGEWDYEKQI